MKRWNWKSFWAGSVSTVLVMGLGVTAFAASNGGKVSFNTVNLETGSSTVARANDSYRLQNGQYVPYSITYTDASGGGTVYLPIRKISEFTNTGIEWDGASNKVIINANTSSAYQNMTKTYDDGYQDGYNAGLRGNSSSGNYDKGYDDGYDDGYADGQRNNTSGGNYTTGYNDGYNVGYSLGYAKGKAEGGGTGTTDRYQEGYDAGFAAGKAQGVTEGEKTGYDKGLAAGEASGYQKGYEAGYADGKAGVEQQPGGTDKPSEPGGSDVEFDRDSVSEEDMQNYLDKNVPNTLETPLGTYQFTIEVSKNSNKNIPYDFWIKTSHPHNPSWIDFKDSLDLNPQDVAKTIDLLRNYQISVYEAAWKCAPGAKMQGGYFNSWYEYPSIHEGYENLKVFSWQNYEDGNVFDGYYETSHYSGFKWTPEVDDYVF